MGYGVYDHYDLGNYEQKGTIETQFGSRAELEAMPFDGPDEVPSEVAEMAMAAREAVGGAGFEATEAVHAAGIMTPLLVDADLPQLSNEEFLNLQLSLGAAESDTGLESPELEFALPSVGDHSMLQYIRLLTEIRDQESR